MKIATKLYLLVGLLLGLSALIGGLGLYGMKVAVGGLETVYQDRVVPLPTSLYEELGRYWKFHRHPLLLFPNVGRGENTPEAVAKRMREAMAPMSCSALQRLLIVARKELNIPAASIHSLRHSFATHLLEAGAHLHTIQRLLGHKQITSTMVYLHLTHQTTREALGLMDELCRNLPR